ncbi:MAG: hypothetical protein HY657_13125, partial [Acidobacteria bacterium]|nr:hypothetical protein [Acidobacteriota bacterium]
MNCRVFRRAVGLASAVTVAFALGVLMPEVSAQQAAQPQQQAPQGGRGQQPPGARGQGGGRGQQAPATPRAAAPVDLTGTWVSVITEDWRFRMLTPPKGDFASLPLNAEGQRVGNEWDPARDIAAGDQCKAFGAIGLMRMPTRLRISWQDDTTLKIEADNGTQTRLFHFRSAGGPVLTAPAGEAPSWQGDSVAHWETQAEGSGVAGGGG